MGLFDFFMTKKQEPSQEIVKFEDISKFINKKRAELEVFEKKAIFNLKSIILDLIFELKEEKEALGVINIREKREHEKIKEVVIQNLELYSEILNKFIENLQALNENELQIFMNELNKIILDFDKRSKVPFERATILIGKELGEIKETIFAFLKKLNSLFDEHNKILSSLKALENVKNDLINFKNIESEKSEVARIVKQLEFRQQDIELKEDKINKKIEEFKQSQEYFMEKEAAERVSLMKKQIELAKLKLRKNIDFKRLESLYHSNEKKMKVIKNFEDDFNRVFEKDNDLILLFEDNKKEAIVLEIDKINQELKEIEKIQNSGRGLESIQNEKNQLLKQLEEIKEEKMRNAKRLEKIKENLENVKKNIEKNIESLNIKIIF